MKRRDLLIAAAANPVFVVGCGGGSEKALTAGLANPSPLEPEPVPAPSTPAVVPDSAPAQPAPPPADGDLFELGLASTVGGPQPFTVGQVFRKGDIPSGTAITASISQFQAEVRNRWSDGSARFAVLSGVAAPGVIAIRKGGTPSGGANVAEPGVEAVVTFTGVADSAGNPVAGGTLSANLAEARAQGAGAWSRTTARKVREMLGPVMSEFHYFVPTADAHTHVWFYLRAYATGQIEVETVVENGWLLVASPSRRNYNVSVAVGGSQRYIGAGLVQYHHTRWSRIDWVGVDPEVTPKHDVAYLKATPLVLGTAVSTLNASAYTSTPDDGTKYSSWSRTLASQPPPFAIANIDPALGGGGHSDNVGLLPAWDMAYLVEAHSGAYWAVLGNARAGGRFCVHYRDETTGRPVRGSKHGTLSFHDDNVGIGDNSGAGTSLTPAPLGGIASPSWSYSHGPSLGYLAYLLTGRWSHWEELQFFAAATDFTSNSNLYQGFRIVPWWQQLRTHAWMFRARSQAAHCAPQYLGGVPTSGEDAAQQTEATGRVDADAAFYYDSYIADIAIASPPNGRLRKVANNPFGMWFQNTDLDLPSEGGGAVKDNVWTIGGFLASGNAMSVMWAAVSEATTSSKLRDLAAWSARFPVGMLGGLGGGWDWRVFAWYSAPWGTGGASDIDTPDPNSTYRASWGAMWTFLTTTCTWTGGNPFPLPPDNKLRQFYPGASFRNGQGDWQMGSPITELNPAGSTAIAQMIGAVAMAHELAGIVPIPGAAAMAANFYGSDSWVGSVAGSGFRNYPGWAIRSRRQSP